MSNDKNVALTLTLTWGPEFNGVHEALQQYLDNQPEEDDPDTLPELCRVELTDTDRAQSAAVQKLVYLLDAAMAKLAE